MNAKHGKRYYPDLFDTAEFKAEYEWSECVLGTETNGSSTIFRLWAPTAEAVTLNLYREGSGGEAYERFDMTRGSRGVWSFCASCGYGVYYTYTVTVDGIPHETIDPYAVAAGVNGKRGMVTDLRATNPQGFEEEHFVPRLGSFSDAVIWEVHIRDFSSAMKNAKYKGKYLAFTERGLVNSAGVPVGLDYLRELGVTHVQLLPIFDFASVDESRPDKGYNWGYDPLNYNVPEGSYSTDPYNGAVRIRELKSLIMALHKSGIGVIMDVVYNHTYNTDSPLDRTVPFYFHRYDKDGKPGNGSGCGNETASERAMFRGYMISSLSYWLREYHLDGFRFDLMAVHDIELMQEIESILHDINPHCLIYGEGWNGGKSLLAENRRCDRVNISRIKPGPEAVGAVGVFNDAIRDGLKGSVFEAEEGGYVNGCADTENAQKVIFGLTGGANNPFVNWTAQKDAVINYTSCHDNMTLYDKLRAVNPKADISEIAAMNRLCAAVLMLSRGAVFFQAGEEMLRTKGGDENSYRSGDAVNHIDWESLVPGSAQHELMEYYKMLIKLRQDNPFLRRGDLSCRILAENVIEVRYINKGSIAAVAFINPNKKPVYTALPEGEWNCLLGTEKRLSASVRVEGISAALYKRKA